MVGETVKVGARWQEKYQEGERLSLHPAFDDKDSAIWPGFPCNFRGGDTVYAITPPEVMPMVAFGPTGDTKRLLPNPFLATWVPGRSLYRTDR